MSIEKEWQNVLDSVFSDLSFLVSHLRDAPDLEGLVGMASVTWWKYERNGLSTSSYDLEAVFS
jgi:hypothetical protein